MQTYSLLRPPGRDEGARKWNRGWEQLFDALALFFLSAVKNLKNAAAQPAGPPAEQEALTSKSQSRQRGFKFQKEVRRNDTQSSENDFGSSFSAVVLTVLSVLVIYVPSK